MKLNMYRNSYMYRESDFKRPCLLVYKKTGWEAYPGLIEGVQAVTGRKTRGRCEPQSQLLCH